AVEYSDPGTEVVVDVLKEENFLKISISNIGEVISEAARPHMFEKFYRAAEAKKVKEGGTGMGLYIVKLFVEKLGGRVGFESEDHKTVFWFTLPLNH
ncbi:MAG: Sensor protein VanS, partial [Candidatus Collierbacteria bacterium GW2011_GWA1_44_12]